jgi:hypothetical protein
MEINGHIITEEAKMMQKLGALIQVTKWGKCECATIELTTLR